MKDTLIYTTAICPFCVRAKMLLDHKGVEYTEIDIHRQQGARQEMMQRANRHTVPQIFVGDTHVGGCDDLFALEHQGKLDALLAE
ncbi:glutaredoxin 3 [Pontibacterium sp. N1Y112]|jgi:glutaredoxin 3|uniref:Glutaredoxin n=1 Tax=Pontibacterium sinense TaxID=2781979 RepID=A0A8J7FFH5_9GAMM|nr:glutaredoxin 3 [Pontibacterium sinense]MBE9399127.1 glutaredoxin 3 [Pontibacterium sinense]MCO4756776.1 glutaredoxin 3 [Oceanospirillaceae bacterium]